MRSRITRDEVNSLLSLYDEKIVTVKTDAEIANAKVESALQEETSAIRQLIIESETRNRELFEGALEEKISAERERTTLEIEELRKMFGSLSEEVQNDREKVVEWQDACTVRLDAMAADIAAILRWKVEVKRELDSLAAKQMMLERTNEKLRVELEKLTERVGRQESGMADLVQKFGRLDSQLAGLKDKIDAQSKGANAALEEALKKLRSELQRSVDGVQRSVDKETMERTKQVMKIDTDQTNRLKSGLHDLEQRISATASKIRADLQSQLEPVRQNVETLEGNVKSAVKKVSTLDDSVTSMKGDVREMKEAAVRQWEQVQSQVKETKEHLQSAIDVVDANLLKTKEAVLLEVSSVRERVEGLEVAVESEVNCRIAGDRELASALGPFKKVVFAELQAKANLDDVRRALWLKVDKADLPMAFSTQSVRQSQAPQSGAPLDGHQACAVCQSNGGPGSVPCVSCAVREESAADHILKRSASPLSHRGSGGRTLMQTGTPRANGRLLSAGRKRQPVPPLVERPSSAFGSSGAVGVSSAQRAWSNRSEWGVGTPQTART